MAPKLNIRVPVSIALPGLTSACMNAQVNLKLGSQLQEEHMHKKGSGKGARELTNRAALGQGATRQPEGEDVEEQRGAQHGP